MPMLVLAPRGLLARERLEMDGVEALALVLGVERLAERQLDPLLVHVFDKLASA